MKALVFSEPWSVKLVEIDIPKPGPNEVLAKMVSVGICGSDVGIFEGNHWIIAHEPGGHGHETGAIAVEVGKNLEGKIIELRNKTIPDIDKKIEDTEDKIDEIKIKSGEASLGKYTEKIKTKQKLERLIERQKSVLKSHFGGNNEKLEENISQWDEEIGIKKR